MARNTTTTATHTAGGDTPPGPLVRVLGPLAVEVSGRTLHVAGAQRRRLLALLASRAGRVASVDAIVDALWGEDPPPSASKTVQSHVVRLRRSLAALGDAPIETVVGGYRLALDAARIDARRFEDLRAQGREFVQIGDHPAAVVRFSAALELWRGPAYMEFRDLAFAVAEGVRLDELRLATVEDLAAAQLLSGAATSAIPALERLVRDAPGREPAWGLLMRALYASGRQHDALGAFQRARHQLAESFGLEPGPELRAVERQILDRDPTLTVIGGRRALAAALQSPTPVIGRTSERAALDTAWRMARAGSGQLRILSGPSDVGRTRLAADLAGRVLSDGGDVEYLRAADGLAALASSATTSGGEAAGAIVDAIAARCRETPLLLVVDDAEWSDAPAVDALRALAAALEDLTLLLVVIVDPTGGGPSVAAIGRLDPDGSRNLEIGPLPDDDVATIVAAEGVDADAVPAVVAVAAGLPGLARREAAAWAERTASDRLRAAAASSSGALAVAEQAQVSVLDEVLELVAARARRDEMRSAKWFGRQPYRALACYEPQDAELFVGRERLVAELAARVLDRRLVVVVGPSGSGKSSIVRAGLVPLARSGRLPGDAPWPVHLIVPGRDPLAARAALDEVDERGPRLLVVDQFEEVFAAAPATVDTFATWLLDLAGDPALDVHVVIVVRADEYGALTAVAGLAEAVAQAQLVVGPPSDEEMRRIVDEPARRTGLGVEPALLDLIAEDIGGHDAALPLVSAAMAELWDRRDGPLLRADRYVEMGGIATAVERLGEQALAHSSRSEIAEVQQMALLLADVTDSGQFTRRRVPIVEIPEQLAPAVERLVNARLVVRGETTVELVHEVVLRAWPRLAAWLDEARIDLMRGRQLVVAARTWKVEGRSDDNVYRGDRLAAGLELVARKPDDAPADVVAFLEAGRRLADRERQVATARAHQQARTNRRLRRLLAGSAVLLVAALVAGGLAVRQADRADREGAAAVEARQRADATALIADAERLGARAGLEDDLDTSLLLAAQAYTMADTRSTRGALLRAVERSPAAVATVRSDGPRLLDLELSPDGRLLAVNDNRGGTTVYDLAAGGPPGHHVGGAVGGLAWTPDGTGLVRLELSDGHDPSDPEGSAYDAVVLDATSFQERARYTGRTETSSDLVFSPDGRWLVASPSFSNPGRVPQVTVWDATRPGPPARTVELPDATQRDEDDVSFDATGERFAVSVAGATVLIDLRTGARLESFAGSGGLFSPDGRTLAVNAGPGDPLRLELIDVETGGRLPLQGAHSRRILHRSFNRDGTLLATSGDDRLVRLWDTATGRELRTLSGHTGRVLASAFSPDATTLYSTGLDRSVITWDLAGRNTIEREITPADPADYFSERFAVTSDGSAAALIPLGGDVLRAVDLVSGVRADPIDTGHGRAFGLVAGAGSTVFTGGADGVIRRWDVSTGERLAERSLEGAGIYLLALAPDRSALYVQTSTGMIRALDPQSLERIDDDELDIGREVITAAVSPDGRALAISTFDPPTVSVFDLRTGRSRSVAVTSDVVGLAFAPDSGMLIAGDNDGQVMRVDPANAALLGAPVIAHDGPVTNVSFSPDGAWYTSGSTDGTIRLWDSSSGHEAGSVQPGPPNAEARATWSSDGHTLLVMYRDGAVHAVDTRPASWLAHACRTAGRQLTATEWAELLPDRPYEPACR